MQGHARELVLVTRFPRHRDWSSFPVAVLGRSDFSRLPQYDKARVDLWRAAFQTASVGIYGWCRRVTEKMGS